MRPVRPALLALLLAACAQPAPRAEEADGAAAKGAPPPYHPAGPCADGPGFAACSDSVEAAQMALSGAASRAGDTILIRTAAGATIPFAGDRTDGREVRYRYRGWIAPHRFHLLTRTHIEHSETLLVSAADGGQFSIFGDPVFSADGRRMATASLDLEAGHQPNGIWVWRVREGMVQLEWGVTGGDGWGASRPEWADSAAVRFVRHLRSESAPGHEVRIRAVLRFGADGVSVEDEKGM